MPANVAGPTNFSADFVITGMTFTPALIKRRATSTALYAAMLPVTQRAIDLPATACSARVSREGTVTRETYRDSPQHANRVKEPGHASLRRNRRPPERGKIHAFQRALEREGRGRQLSLLHDRAERRHRRHPRR